MASVIDVAPDTRVPPDVEAPSEVAPPLTRIERRRATRRSWDALVPWIVGLATLGLRLATAATGPTDWDSAQYAAAVNRFDVTHGQPQPPGYWLYVVAGRVLHEVSGLGVVRSLVLVSALASAVAAGLTVLAGRGLGGRWVGLAAGVVVATSPFAWFSGSIIATYSFDMIGCSLLIILAWRARPNSWHGLAAVVALGILAGFRQSMVQSFGVLALVAVVASTRRIGRLLLTVAAGAASVAVWLIPMSISQPGGLSAWIQATRTETTGAARATSVFDHAAASGTNLGTFAATTLVALAPLALAALLAGVALALRAAWGSSGTSQTAGPLATDRQGGNRWRRPWYQSRTAVLAAALVPAMALVALVQFAKGGYLLAYLPAAVIAFLLPLGALNRQPSDGGRTSPGWLVVTTLLVIGIAALGAQRFLTGTGVLPANYVNTKGGLWLQQPRYQAPYTDTRDAIRSADTIDAALAGLAPSVDARRDVVLFDALDGGLDIYRNAGWSLPDDRIAVVQPGSLMYNELGGALYYTGAKTVALGPGGSALLVASPSLPGLSSLIAQGSALPVNTPRPIPGFKVWRLIPGTDLLGVQMVATSGPRPLGTGISP
jgi:hypothetical protein